MADHVAQAARDFQHQRTGHVPKSVSVVLSNDTLVITLYEALSPAERSMAISPAGAAKVREFHRQLFADSSKVFAAELKRITGVDVRESTAEVETDAGAVVQVFASGTMVQVFQLARTIPEKTWRTRAHCSHNRGRCIRWLCGRRRERRGDLPVLRRSS
jgi:uncharacterized protein YbcI